MNENESVVVTNEDLSEQLSALLEGQKSTNEQISTLVQFANKADARAENLAKEQAEEKAQEEKIAKAEAKQESAKAQTNEQQEATQTETLQAVQASVDLTNHIMAGQICFLGVLVGVLLMKIFWDRFHI